MVGLSQPTNTTHNVSRYITKSTSKGLPESKNWAQRSNRGDNCVICVERCEISRGDLSLTVIDDLSEMIGWVKERRGYFISVLEGVSFGSDLIFL